MLYEVFSLCYVWCLDASGPRSARVVRFARWRPPRVRSAASQPQAISPNIIVFVVHGSTFMNVSALGICAC